MTRDARSLCKSCGLCCDGSLFWAVPLRADEMGFETHEGAGCLRQPCVHHRAECSVYNTRPSGCDAFNCHVLSKVMAGTHSRAWAQHQIANMRKAIGALSSTLPGSDPSIYRRAAEFLSDHSDVVDTPEFAKEYSDLMQHITQFEQMWWVFHTPKKQG